MGMGKLRLLVGTTVLGVVIGCGSGAGDGGGGPAGGSDPGAPGDATPPGSSTDPNGGSSADALRERPWEVLSSEGETYLANVFYADPSENEQIMPWAINGRPAIDRMVYPTIGNPNLYVKDDASDEMVVVLRIEDDAYVHLQPKVAPSDGMTPSAVTFTADDKNHFSFYLVARPERAVAEGADMAAAAAGVYAITPAKVLMNAEPADMPAALKARHTLRFVFDQAAMKGVPAGLYDARFEVEKQGAIFAGVYEFQSNAVRVFDHADDTYTALNVTDTQTSVGAEYHSLTADHLDDFVDAVNAETDPSVRSAAFITFNGDLHNGGSPGTLRQRPVATTYNDEAVRVLGALKRLNLPIFLTPGNHDGYASTGQVPSGVADIDSLIGDSLQKVVSEQNQIAWPGFDWNAYAQYVAATAAANQLEGLHRDIVTGGFTRAPGDTFSAAFKEVARGDRNIMLYDGFYQWQKSYGPLYESWRFGRNRYVSLNTYELRQHRRTGWGMYTVNYGGDVTKAQLDWLDRELARSKVTSDDVILLMHHDPRGGHKGVDFGYYFPMLQYTGMTQSAINYLIGDKFTPLVCKLGDDVLSIDDSDACLHDGLQEWMAPDGDFDGSFMSGIELLSRIIDNPQIRTLLIGHAHLNSMEVLQTGDTLVPGKVTLDANGAAGLAWLEGANPVRNLAWERALGGEATTQSLSARADSWRSTLDQMLAGQNVRHVMDATSTGAPRELAILRMTSNADLSNETYDSQSMYGWSVLHVTTQAGPTPKVNGVSYFIHAGTDAFNQVETVDVDRTKSMTAKDPNNRVAQLFTW